LQKKGKVVLKDKSPVRIGVAGLTHGHVSWILQRPNRGDIEIVGIAEPDEQVVQRYAQQFGFKLDLVYQDLATMLDETHPEAVVAFGSVYEHLAMVEACAPRGIHVMVEKPLAVSVEHALQMERLVKQHSIHLLTNYETTWYASNHTAYEMINDERRIGDIRKIVVCDGHLGPQELGVPPEFLAWLTDPLQNGGGALIDFGCYGANLITWLMHGVKPVAVTAVTQQIKPDIYPNVDDEATIILTYPQAQGIIQASWNWPVSRKDIAVYGQTGYVKALNKNTLQLRENEQQSEETLSLEPRPASLADPFAYLAGVVRGLIQISDTDLSSLANNLTVVRILEAARHSAQLGKTILLETSEK
jgi:predicted dehydrogenase